METIRLKSIIILLTVCLINTNYLNAQDDTLGKAKQKIRAKQTSKAILAIESNSCSIHYPRVTSDQRMAMIPSADKELIVYDITTNSHWYRKDFNWIEIETLEKKERAIATVDKVSPKIAKGYSQLNVLGDWQNNTVKVFNVLDTDCGTSNVVSVCFSGPFLAAHKKIAIESVVADNGSFTIIARNNSGAIIEGSQQNPAVFAFGYVRYY